MSLATRCTSCGTVFRVVQDQLKVSEGWVRCGRCDAVFNALEGLFDLGRDAPAELGRSPIVSMLATERAARSAECGAARRRREAAESTHSDEGPSLEPRPTLLADPGSMPTRSTPHAVPGARSESDVRGAGRRARPASSSPTPASTPTCSPTTRRCPTPSWSRCRRSTSAATCRSRAPTGSPISCAAPSGARAGSSGAGARGAWASLRALALLRARAAGRPPLSRQPGGAAGRRAAAARRLVPRRRLQRSSAPRRIDDVLGGEHRRSPRRPASTPSCCRSTLRNRSALPLRHAVDRPEPDRRQRSAGRAPGALRRATSAPPSAMPPGAETALQRMLDAGARRVAGYTVEIFYP